MPSPVAPNEFCEAVPGNNTDMCVKVEKFFNVPQKLCDLFNWMLTPDGAISDAFKMEVASFLMPTGSFLFSATLNMGSAFLQCTGVAISRTTYAALFAQIGTRYGAGDGSTTFNLPNLQGRSPIGAGSGSGLTFRDINNPNVGEEDHELTEAENGAHRHLIADPMVGSVALTSSDQTLDNDVSGGLTGYTLEGKTGEEATVGRTSVSGGGQGHNTVHPCFVGFWFIKL
jgi:microcystin-dependent protein